MTLPQTLSFAMDDMTVAEVLSYIIDGDLGKQISQKELSEKTGFKTPNVIYMLKTGKTKVPLDKAGKIAEGLGLNAHDFWFKCFKEYMPDIYEEYKRVNKLMTLSSDEISFVKQARKREIPLNAATFQKLL